jgi:hypothetical protein
MSTLAHTCSVTHRAALRQLSGSTFHGPLGLAQVPGPGEFPQGMVALGSSPLGTWETLELNRHLR